MFDYDINNACGVGPPPVVKGINGSHPIKNAVLKIPIASVIPSLNATGWTGIRQMLVEFFCYGDECNLNI